MRYRLSFLCMVLLMVPLAGCFQQSTVSTLTASPTPSSTPTNTPTTPPSPVDPSQLSNVTVSWSPNRETAVNSAGGGYRVYYSQTSGFSLGSASSANVSCPCAYPASVSTVLTGLAPGTWYIKVVAYSALVPPGTSSGASSAASVQTSITVP